MKVTLRNVRISFPSLWEPDMYDPDNPRYKAHFLMEKGSSQHKEVMKAIKEVAISKWGNRVPKMPTCLHDGSEKEYEYYQGQMFVSANSKQRPRVVVQQRRDIGKDEGILRGGDYVTALLEIWPQEHHKYKNRINCILRGVQLVKAGEPFGGSGRVQDDEFDFAETMDDNEIEDDFFEEEDVDDFLK